MVQGREGEVDELGLLTDDEIRPQLAAGARSCRRGHLSQRPTLLLVGGVEQQGVPGPPQEFEQPHRERDGVTPQAPAVRRPLTRARPGGKTVLADVLADDGALRVAHEQLGLAHDHRRGIVRVAVESRSRAP